MPFLNCKLDISLVQLCIVLSAHHRSRQKNKLSVLLFLSTLSEPHKEASLWIKANWLSVLLTWGASSVMFDIWRLIVPGVIHWSKMVIHLGLEVDFGIWIILCQMDNLLPIKFFISIWNPGMKYRIPHASKVAFEFKLDRKRYEKLLGIESKEMSQMKLA